MFLVGESRRRQVVHRPFDAHLPVTDSHGQRIGSLADRTPDEILEVMSEVWSHEDERESMHRNGEI